MLYTPTFFISAVSGLIRLGKGFREIIRDRHTEKTFQVLLSKFPEHDAKSLERLAFYWLYNAAIADPKGPVMSRLLTGGDLSLLFTPNCLLNESVNTYEFNTAFSSHPDRDEQIASAFSLYFEHVRHTQEGEWGAEFARMRSQSPLVAFVHEKWVTDNEPSAWGSFGMELADVALEVIGAQPEVLGMSQKANNVLRSLLPNFERLVEKRKLDNGEGDPLGKELMKTFVYSALDCVAQHPGMVTDEDRWEPVIQGMVMPLKQEMETVGGDLQFIAKERLGRALKGPVIVNALAAIDANSEAFLKGDAKQGKLLGEVSRTILRSLVDQPPPDGFDLRNVFSEPGIMRIYDSAIKTAARRPDLFVRGSSDEAVAGQEFLQKMAGKLNAVGLPPFDKDVGLRAELVTTVFEVAADYGERRFMDNSDGGNWDNTWADVYSTLLKDILGGLEDGIMQKLVPGPAGGVQLVTDESQLGLFGRMFSREQAVGIVKVIARHVSATPHMITGKDANPEAANIARVAAAAIASDSTGLLHAEDWRRVISAMLGVAAANPGVLFSVDVEDGYANQLGLTLIQHVLLKAQTSMQGNPRQAGRVLFGETLREALIATVQAATGNLRDSVMTQTASGERSHVSALGQFIDQLNGFATSGDSELAMNADDWLHVYKYFLAHILEKGPEGLADFNEAAVKEALRSDVNLARIQMGA